MAAQLRIPAPSSGLFAQNRGQGATSGERRPGGGLVADMDAAERRRFELGDLFAEEDETSDDENRGVADLVNSGQAVEVAEVDASGHKLTRWLHSPGGSATRVKDEAMFVGADDEALRGWRKALFTAFLPVGFPDSVSADYVAYQMYDSLQAFFSTIASLLANRALLRGLGVGDATSSATFAMLLTVFKDATGRVATIAFAHRYGLSIEPEAKGYRFLADLFNDTAFFLELCSPYLGSWAKVAALCTGEALRAICGVAAGASKAALSLHFATGDNVSELNAKEASQETAVGLVGLLVGSLVVRLVQDERAVVYLMIALVLGHLWMNHRAVRCVNLRTLNKQRATILFYEFMKSFAVWTPLAVAMEERILFWDQTVRNARGLPVFRIDFARNYADAVGDLGADAAVVAVDGPMHTKFVRPYAPGRPGRIKIMLWSDAEAKDAILAYFMAMETAWVAEKDVPWGDAKKPAANSTGRPRIVDGWRPRARNPMLWKKLDKYGWDLDVGALEMGAGGRLHVQMTRRKAD